MEKTVDQLKVEAYDYLAAVEHYQALLRETNQKIAKKSQEVSQNQEENLNTSVLSSPEQS